MRNREQIEAVARSVESPDIRYQQMEVQKLVLEVLLDIRELLLSGVTLVAKSEAKEQTNDQT